MLIDITVTSNGDIHIRNELDKMNTNLCLWVLGQGKIMIFKILPLCPFEGSLAKAGRLGRFGSLGLTVLAALKRTTWYDFKNHDFALPKYP